jgi:hypothetical protein
MAFAALAALVSEQLDHDKLTLKPEPAAVGEEMSVKEALRLYPDLARAAIDVEMDKQTVKYKSLRRIAYNDIKPDAVKINGKLFLKPKFHSGSPVPYKLSARLAANGSRQPADSYGITFAATTDDGCKLAMLAAYHAAAVQNKKVDSLVVSDFDINGAFLHEPLTPENSPRQIVMILPDAIPHPLAGCWVELQRAVYGLKQSNAVFDAGLKATLATAGFLPTAADPRIFVKIHPTDSSLSCAVAMHVDDGLICSTHQPYHDELVTTLTTRYGPLSFNSDSTSNTGFALSRGADGSITISQEGYLRRMLHDLGADELPPTATPSLADLFKAPTDTTPVDPSHFRKVIGCLLYLLKTRHDIRKEVQYLATRSNNPTASCREKLLRVLGYLNTTPTLGARYHTSEGARLYAYVDASYCVHTDGRSHSGFYICLGKDSAPIFSYAGRQTSCVSTGSMEAEYVALTKAAKKLIHFRQLMDNLGFKQSGPSIIFEDNKSAINLANAPEITKNSKHIFSRHHYIRDLVAQKHVTIEHLKTELMTADLLTKPLAKQLFWFLRGRLMNETNKPTPPWSTLRGECETPVSSTASPHPPTPRPAPSASVARLLRILGQ